MPSSTTYYSLTTFNSSTDQSETFLDYRTAIAGVSAASNMGKIDTAMNDNAVDITALEARKQIVAVPAIYDSPNTYLATVSAITSYETDSIIALNLDTDSDGTVTININSLGAKSVMKINSSGTAINLSGSDMRASREYNCKYDGTRYVWMDATAADQINVNGTSGNFTMINSDNELEDSTTAPDDFVTKALYDANTILAATSDDTPAALTVAEQTLVGRITAGSIDALTATEVRNLLNVADGAEVNPDLVSQAEAEAGVATTERIWSAERVSQAIVAQNLDVAGTSGEALSARDRVFLKTSDNLWYKVDNDSSTPLVSPTRGLVVSSVAISNPVDVRIIGDMDGFTSLTAGEDLWASDTAGGYTQTHPAPVQNGSQIVIDNIGKAISTTSVLLKYSPITFFKKAELASSGTLTIVHTSDATGRIRRPFATQVVATYGSDTTSGQTISVDSESGANVKARGVDDSDATYWSSTNTAFPHYFRVDYGAGNEVAIGKITIRSRTVDFDLAPDDFLVRGSQNASDWDTLLTVTSAGFASNELKTWTFFNEVEYRYYEIYITANADGVDDSAQIVELEMMVATSRDESIPLGGSDLTCRYDSGSDTNHDTNTTFTNTSGAAIGITTGIELP